MNLDKMDRMDRMLSRLPSEEAAGDLSARISRYVRARHVRNLYGRFGLSLVLALGGMWLISPLVSTLPASVPLPGSGAVMLSEWVQAALGDLQAFLASAWGGFTSLQSGVAAPMTLSILLGLAILALSALVAASPLLQQTTGLSHKGA